ncbi:MAG: choice-of-anchor B family protein [Crocinitomix sp.]|nr:choice-of-anchor B family protein [Crocinitomix sp.]
MIKSYLTILSIIAISAYGQLNITEIGYLDIPDEHSTICNDIWGYTDEVGNEYALIGTETGLSVVDVTEPTTPTEVFWTDGLYSVWRDVKVYEDYAYVTTEAEQGLMIVDLSGLPGDTDLPVTLYTGPEDASWQSAHNLFQADGYIYIFGANRGAGGVIILDVHTDPLNPIEVGVFDDWYVHDGFVRDDIAYFGHIYEGIFSIVDLTDKTSPVLLGSSSTPSIFTHNVWVSEDGNSAYTTDEVSNGFIGSFDVSDPTNIKYLDKIQSSPGNDIVPHNAHVKGNYLYTSYYTDGLVIHDVTHPDNMVEVGNFDTSPFGTPDTKGCWGVYPFFESGNIIASDRQKGLFVLGFDAQQGAYLKGNITELGTGFNLNDVEVTIEGTETTDYSNVIGDYATGTVDEGVLEVTYFKTSYQPQTIPITFEQGEMVVQDVVLEKLPEFDLRIRVRDAETMSNIPDAWVLLEHTYTEVEEQTGITGILTTDLYYEDNYQLTIGKWGYETICIIDTLITADTEEIEIYLEEGYFDDFTFDFEWMPSGWAAVGNWEREIPIGVTGPEGDIENPYTDVPFDCGDKAYLTGNGSIVSNTDQIDNGSVFLMSPTFDLTDYDNPHVNFSLWYYNTGGETAPNDTLEIHLLNGTGSVVLVDKVYNENITMSTWTGFSIDINEHLPITATMRLRIKIGDELDSDHITEAGVDAFSITDYSIAATSNLETEEIALYPNPFNDNLTLNGVVDGNLAIYDISGRYITSVLAKTTINTAFLDKGTYLFVLSDSEGNPIKTFRQVKL